MKTLRILIILLIVSVFTFLSCEENGTTGPSNHPLSQFSNPFPPDGATEVNTDSITFSWTCTDPDEDVLIYSLTIWIYELNCGPTVFTNLSESNFTLTNLYSGVHHLWRVTAEDVHGAIIEGPIWHFQTEDWGGGVGTGSKGSIHPMLRRPPGVITSSKLSPTSPEGCY